jgi:glycosyltransferase involved in cell wall biosynthesis
MMQQLLNGLGGDARSQRVRSQNLGEFACYHINCRFSDNIEDIGRVRWVKVFRLLRYCVAAVACRWRFRATTLVYVPAPPVRSALCRDWLVMLLCRCFFKRKIFYWHAAGLGSWLTSQARPWERWLTRNLLGNPDLSIVLGESGRDDAVALDSREIAIVPNGIPDPCPDFAQSILPQRELRSTSRIQAASGTLQRSEGGDQRRSKCCLFRVLFLGLCYREKGIFDAVDATAKLNGKLAGEQSSLRVQLNVAGSFFLDAEQKEFELRIRQQDLKLNTDDRFPMSSGAEDEPAVRYHGFVTGLEKRRLFMECDCFCLPTYYSAESFPLVLLEAMAYGMDIVTTRWRSIPELLPEGYPGIVDSQSPVQIAAALALVSRNYQGDRLRHRFEEHYTDHRWIVRMKEALAKVN